MHLYELIEYLEKEPQDKIIPLGFHEPHSYRGYYQDLAFEPKENITIAEMLMAVKGALDKTFEGYKGGDFIMNKYTDCWISHYGESQGQKIGIILMDYMTGKYAALVKGGTGDE